MVPAPHGWIKDHFFKLVVSGRHTSEPILAFSDLRFEHFLSCKLLLVKVFTAKDSSIHYVTFFVPSHLIVRFILDFQVALLQELLIILPECLNFFDDV